MARYFAHISDSGPIRYGRFPVSIGALETQDKPMPIGMASTIGRTEAGLALWKLTVHCAEVPRRWVIVDRRFVTVEGTPA